MKIISGKIITKQDYKSQILEMLSEYYATTTQIAKQLNIPTRKAYNLLMSMQSEGLVWSEDPNESGNANKDNTLDWFISKNNIPGR